MCVCDVCLCVCVQERKKQAREFEEGQKQNISFMPSSCGNNKQTMLCAKSVILKVKHFCWFQNICIIGTMKIILNIQYLPFYTIRFIEVAIADLYLFLGTYTC